MASKPIYQIYAELQDYKPKIWRRFQVMNDITVARLAYILMTLFEIFEDENISGKDLPRVIDGEGFGIIEDCGGIMGLEDIRKAFKIKKGEDYEMYSNWLGMEELDLEKCDLDDLNFRLKKLPRVFRDSYEYKLEPSEYSIKILNREYK